MALVGARPGGGGKDCEIQDDPLWKSMSEQHLCWFFLLINPDFITLPLNVAGVRGVCSWRERTWVLEYSVSLYRRFAAEVETVKPVGSSNPFAGNEDEFT